MLVTSAIRSEQLHPLLLLLRLLLRVENRSFSEMREMLTNEKTIHS
jgi:hypothetical protein